MATHRATNDPKPDPVEEKAAEAKATADSVEAAKSPDAKADADAKVDADKPVTAAEKAKAERREAETPERSEYVEAVNAWVLDIAKAVDDAQEALADVIDGHLNLMDKLPGPGDAQAHMHVARVRGALDDLARELGRTRTVASDLAAAAG